MEAVSPDIAKKLLSRDFANLVGRVQKGGKLTRAERAMLQTLATGTGAAPTTAPSYVELAAILGGVPLPGGGAASQQPFWPASSFFFQQPRVLHFLLPASGDLGDFYGRRRRPKKSFGFFFTAQTPSKASFWTFLGTNLL